MSISPVINTYTHQLIYHYDTPKDSKIKNHILELLTSIQLSGKIIIPYIDFKQIKETLKVVFSQQYPQVAPIVIFQNQYLQQNISNKFIQNQWNSLSDLCKLIQRIIEILNNFIEDKQKILKNNNKYQNIIRNVQKQQRQNCDQLLKKRVMMNGCADNQLTQTKNLNRHFRSKIRQVYFQIIKQGDNIPQDAKWIQSSFSLPRVGFQDISRVLKNQWFNKQINIQMQNGKFMHKIMKGMMSIKSKKLMVKYYHVMLAAAQDPENFVKWKYQ